jgi:hypothetical protein
LGIVRVWYTPSGAAWQGLVLAALAVAGTVLVLLISALARTEEVAVAWVPIAIIPQIILAGVIAPLPLCSLGRLLSGGLITASWGQRSLEVLLPDGDLSALGLDRAEYGRQVVGLVASFLRWPPSPS